METFLTVLAVVAAGVYVGFAAWRLIRRGAARCAGCTDSHDGACACGGRSPEQGREP